MTEKVDEILEQVFKLQMDEFYEFMRKLQERMVKYQKEMEAAKFI